jgi:hypothetical protein
VETRTTEGAAKRLASRSPRLHGLVTVGIGIGIVVVVALIRAVVHLNPPFLEAFGYIAIAMGLWSVLTGRTFREAPERLPGWWKAGAVIAAIGGGVVGFLVR